MLSAELTRRYAVVAVAWEQFLVNVAAVQEATTAWITQYEREKPYLLSSEVANLDQAVAGFQGWLTNPQMQDLARQGRELAARREP